VSAADYAASGNGLDVLDPGFLESIGASRQGWQNPLEVLEQLLSGLVDGDSDVDPRALESLAGVIDVGQPALLLGALATASIEGLPGGVVSGLPAPAPEPLGPGIFDGLLPDDGAAEIVGALAAISIGFGEAELRSSNRSGWRRHWSSSCPSRC
jgi:hypothetical protein